MLKKESEDATIAYVERVHVLRLWQIPAKPKIIVEMLIDLSKFRNFDRCVDKYHGVGHRVPQNRVRGVRFTPEGSQKG